MSIRLHPKHGLNPTMTTCFFCNEPKDILLLGAAYKDEAPHQIGCVDKEPCNKCKSYMEQGIITISVRDGEKSDNPYRTGGWCVLREYFFERNVDSKELLDSILEKRVVFLEDTV